MRVGRVAFAVALCAALAAGVGCSRTAEPVVESREAMGTVVTITAYGSDEATVWTAIDASYRDIAAIERQLNPYDASSTISSINAAPYGWHTLPPAAVTITERVRALGMDAAFSPTLWGVTRLYGFGGDGSVPETAALRFAVAQSRTLESSGALVRFRPLAIPSARRSGLTTAQIATLRALRPGFDFGGAAKGLAMDAAMTRLRKARGITGALVSSGSSSRVWGRKPDGKPWQVGIEDPREAGRVVAIIGARTADVLDVSTSGDYQQFFIRGGERYHHLLDPATGQPARGLRSLTVYGAISGVDADILSKLFVAGPSAARAYARQRGLGLYAIDHGGRVIAVPAPATARVTFERVAVPKR